MDQTYNFRQSWLWRHAFVNPQADVHPSEQEYFSISLINMREKASMLVSQISSAIPGLTVHDISHLDALWEMASLISEGAITMTPAEAFVFGASIFLHDSAMSLSAYPNGIEDIKDTLEWKDTVASLLSNDGHDFNNNLINNPPQHIFDTALPEVLRQLHAKQAEVIATQGWLTPEGETIYLIEDAGLRHFYGESIGKIAHSHWWSVTKVNDVLNQDLGAFPGKTKSLIDRVKIACLLRLSDALHIDQRRAPLFLQSLTRPKNISALHWDFQRKIAVPHIEHEEIVFTSASPFKITEANSWWLAYDTISGINKEFQSVDSLLKSRNKPYLFKARSVKNSNSPIALSQTILTDGWKPIDTTLKVSNIPQIIESLGGSKLYGDKPTVALRELLQNSADSIQARRKYQNRKENWGEIKVSLCEKEDGFWLFVEDNGLGMSEDVLTGALIDFGTSFWKTSLIRSEFPGLVSKGLAPIGRFGIGFFSVFMISNNVRVISKRFDRGNDGARTLEFSNGIASRPIVSQSKDEEIPVDGGTRVEVLLKNAPKSRSGILNSNIFRGPGKKDYVTLKELIQFIAPSISATIEVIENGKQATAISINDHLKINEAELLSRMTNYSEKELSPKYLKHIQPIIDKNGVIHGRAALFPSEYFSPYAGHITVGGLYSNNANNIMGLLYGRVINAARDAAIPSVDAETLKRWINEQSKLISKSGFNNEQKCQMAEVILECNGDILDLPIILKGRDTWLNLKDLENELINSDEFILVDSEGLEYNSDDDISPRDFTENLVVYENLYFEQHHPGEIISTGNISWPGSLFSTKSAHENEELESLILYEKNLKTLLIETIYKIWSNSEISVDDGEYIEIGTCSGVPIVRSSIIFRR